MQKFLTFTSTLFWVGSIEVKCGVTFDRPIDTRVHSFHIPFFFWHPSIPWHSVSLVLSFKHYIFSPSSFPKFPHSVAVAKWHLQPNTSRFQPSAPPSSNEPFSWDKEEDVVMPMFSFELWFEPEPTWTRPRFGSRFKEIAEPNPRSGSVFRDWTTGLNLVRTWFGPNPFWPSTRRNDKPLSLNLAQNGKMSAKITPDREKFCTVSMMARPLWTYNRIASVIYLFSCFWVWKNAKNAPHPVSVSLNSILFQFTSVLAHW